MLKVAQIGRSWAILGAFYLATKIRKIRIFGFGIRIFLSPAKFAKRFESSNPNLRFVSPLLRSSREKKWKESDAIRRDFTSSHSKGCSKVGTRSELDRDRQLVDLFAALPPSPPPWRRSSSSSRRWGSVRIHSSCSRIEQTKSVPCRVISIITQPSKSYYISSGRVNRMICPPNMAAGRNGTT